MTSEPTFAPDHVGLLGLPRVWNNPYPFGVLSPTEKFNRDCRYVGAMIPIVISLASPFRWVLMVNIALHLSFFILLDHLILEPMFQKIKLDYGSNLIKTWTSQKQKKTRKVSSRKTQCNIQQPDRSRCGQTRSSKASYTRPFLSII